MLIRMIRAGMVLLAVSAAIPGQEFRGAILGRVTDPSGALTPAASVSATNEETNVRIGGRTNAEGNYNIPFLLPGRYTVRVEAAGFRASVRPGIIVQINDRIEINFNLELGATSEAITVTAESPMLQTASAEMGLVVEREMMERLPLGAMNAMNLADMAPGVLAGSGDQMSNSQNEITINGGSGMARGNDITIDGIPNVAPRFNGLAVTVPSPDAIQEFKVQTTMFDAQNGRSNGGAISFTTRGGTNQYHGSGYYFFYDERLNANGWIRNRQGLPRTPLDNNLTGGTLGGPVRLPGVFGLPGYDGRNRTFFFVNYERRNAQNSNVRYARVPTPLERQGNFSQTLSLANTALAIYDPTTTVGNVRQPFPGNAIPASRHDPTGAAVMNLFDLPNQNVAPRIGSFNWSGSGVGKSELDNLTLRFDQVVSDKQRVYLRFGRIGTLAGFYTPMKGALALYQSASSSPADNISPRLNQSAAFDDSYSFTPTLFASFRYGYTRSYLDEYFDGNLRDPRDQKLADVILANQVSKGYALITLGEALPTHGSRVRKSINDTHSLYVTFNQLQGRHTLKYGLDTRVIRWNENQPGTAQNGAFSFDSRFTRSNPSTTASQQVSGTSMAGLLLGIPNGSQIGYNSALSLQNWYTALYLQDDIKITRKLTVNLGIRYEMETPVTERWNRISYGFDAEQPIPLEVPGMQLRGALLFVDTDGRGRRGGRTDTNNFGPRFGFAYQLDGKTVLRGGYGLFYASGLANIASPNGVQVAALGSQPSFNAVTTFSNTSDGGRTAITTLQNPWPNGFVTPTGNSLGPLTEIGKSISFVNPERSLPYNQQWQFSIQRVIGWNTMVDAGYVGSHALKLLNTLNWNERSDEWLQQGLGEYDRIPNPFYGVFPRTSTKGASAETTKGALWVTFPQFANVSVHGLNTNRAVYHSGQLAVRKRTSHGLTLNVNYTYSKNITYDGASLINDRNFRAVAATDRPHIFRVYSTYQLPFGQGKAVLGGARGWTNAIFGGWELGGSLRMTSGTPLSISDTRGRPSPAANPVKTGAVSDRLGDRMDPATGRPLNPFFDTTVWQPLPNDYVISLEPLRYSWLRGPRTSVLAATAFKTFPIRERLRFEFRIEANNALNHPIFGNPATALNNPATFGTITSAGGTRNVNLSGRIRF